MNYLANRGDINKYDKIACQCLWGTHKKNVMFSIMIPTYQRPELLKETLMSAIDQSGFSNYEIVIVDNDGGTTNTATQKLIEEINNPKIVYYKNSENIGIYGNVLRAARLSCGKYLVLLDDDDLLHPDYLKIMSAFIKRYKYYGMIGVGPFHFKDGKYKYKKIKHHQKIKSFHITEQEFFFGCCITSPGTCYPKAIIDDIYNAHEALLMGDQIIQYKALKKYDLIFVDMPLALYRVHNNETKKNEVLIKMIQDMFVFRNQTAENKIMLKLFLKIFYKEFRYLNSKNTITYWKSGLKLKEVSASFGEDITNYSEIRLAIMYKLMQLSGFSYETKHKIYYEYVKYE